MSGKSNEDRYSVSAYKTETDPPVPVLLAIVADGIGGHRAGEIAAEMAVEAISKWIAESDGLQPVEIMRQAIMNASQLIFEHSKNQLEWNGMGSTCACCLVFGDQLYTANLGDSRIYLFRESQIYQLTTDHTWIQEALDAGLITPEQAIGHPNTHIIRRYLGSAEPSQVDFRLHFPGRLEDETQPEASQGMPLNPDDQILLCSDGLTDLVNADEISAALMSGGAEVDLESLIDLANSRGGHDNITIVHLRVPAPSAVQQPQQTKRRSRAAGCISAVVILFALIALVIGSSWLYKTFGTGSQPTASPNAVELLPVQITQPPIITITATPSLESLLTGATSTPAAVNNPGGPGETLTPWPTNTVIP